MRIFFIHQFYRTPNEGGCIRSYYVIKELLNRGHEIILLRDGLDPNPDKKNYCDPQHESRLEIIPAPVSWSNSMGFFTRILTFFRYMNFAIKTARKRKFDLVYAISVPLTTGIVAMRSGKPFLFEVGDLWPDVPIQMKILKNPILKWYSRKIENKIYRKASLIISLSPDIQKNIYEKWPFTANVVIPNFADLNLFRTEGQKSFDNDTEKQRNKIICTYTGTAGIANDLQQLLELAKIAETDFPEFQFEMMISGKEEEKIKIGAPSNVTFIPFGSKKKAAYQMKKSDFNFVCYAQFSLLGSGSPNKFFDGLAASCITVINVDGWIRNLIEEKEAGIFWDVADHRALLLKIREIYQSSSFSKMKRNSLTLAQSFEQKKLTRQLAEQIEIHF